MTTWLTEPVPGEELHVPAPQPIMFHPSPACLADETRGNVGTALYAVDLAVAHNWQGLNDKDREVLATMSRGEERAADIAVFDEIVDEAVIFLSESCCPPGWHVDWHEGNLMLAADEDDA